MRRIVTVLLVLATFVVSLIAPLASQAGSQGRKNTAIGASVATLYFLVKGKVVPGLITGAGSYYAWKRYNDARKYEKRHHYYSYGRGYAHHHRHYRHRVHH